MKKSILYAGFCLLITAGLAGCSNSNNATQTTDSSTEESAAAAKTPSYDVITKGFDWGPGNSKIIINSGEKLKSIPDDAFEVNATKTYTEEEETDEKTDTKQIDVLKTYLSDQKGNQTTKKTNYITLELEVHPDNIFTKPFNYDNGPRHNKNVGIKYDIKQDKEFESADGNKISGLELKAEDQNKIITIGADDFKKSSYQYKDKEHGEIKLSYASYSPENKKKKHPLIIMLHGGGEGGSNAEIPLLGNKVQALASDKIQSYFDGNAYVLAPQSPTRWGDDGAGENSTSGKKNGDSIYTNALYSLIKKYIKSNNIDTDRVYIGGLSQGGFMTVNMLLHDPDMFAGAFAISQLYESDWVTDDQLETIKDLPMWFIHNENDETIPYDTTTEPLVKRLKEANAKDTKLTVYDRVVDTTGTVKDKDGKPYKYDNHYAWQYVFNDEVVDESGTPLFEWLAEQSK